MSEADETSPETQRGGPPESSPLPGCMILSTILLVFGGLIVLYTVVGTYQNRTLDEFTLTEPVELEVLKPTPDEKKTVREKFLAIGKAIAEGRAERFLVTARDLNVLIATEEDLADFRGQTVIDRIAAEGIVARMVQPMRKGVFRKGSRYLDAEFVLQPELRVRTVAFEVMDIRPARGSVPEGFVQNYRALDFFRLDPEWDLIRNHVPSLAAVYTESGKVVIETAVADTEEE